MDFEALSVSVPFTGVNELTTKAQQAWGQAHFPAMSNVLWTHNWVLKAAGCTHNAQRG